MCDNSSFRFSVTVAVCVWKIQCSMYQTDCIESKLHHNSAKHLEVVYGCFCFFHSEFSFMQSAMVMR